MDHGDTLMLRDAGWIQLYCENNQEVHDTLLLAFRLAEDHRILMPVMVCQDAFVLSHTMMMTQIASQEEVDDFLPSSRSRTGWTGARAWSAGWTSRIRPRSTGSSTSRPCAACRWSTGRSRTRSRSASAAGRTTPSCRTGWRTPTP